MHTNGRRNNEDVKIDRMGLVMSRLGRGQTKLPEKVQVHSNNKKSGLRASLLRMVITTVA